MRCENGDEMTRRYYFRSAITMINRLQLLLPQDEFSALVAVALKEMRTPSAQARHMLLQQLTSRGALASDAGEVDPVTQHLEAARKDENGW